MDNNTIQLKIGRNVFNVDKNDLVFDNGFCQQLITKYISHGYNKEVPVLSKKLFADLKKLEFLIIYTPKSDKYKSYNGTFYRFDIERMKKYGY